MLAAEGEGVRTGLGEMELHDRPRSGRSARATSPEMPTFHTQHATVCGCFPHFRALPLRIRLQRVVYNVCRSQTPFPRTTNAVLSVGRPCLFTHVCRYDIYEDPLMEGTKSSLHIKKSDLQDSAIFKCRAKNEHGQDQGQITLSVAEPAEKPGDVRVTETSSRFVHLAWRMSSHSDRPATKYILQYWTSHSSSGALYEDIINGPIGMASVRSLQPGTAYSGTIRAVNVMGPGKPSEKLSFRTSEEEPSGPPTDVTVVATDARSLKVFWKPTVKEQRNGELKGYYVGHRPYGTSAPFTYETVTGDATETAVTGLQPGKGYVIALKAFNSIGPGPLSQEVLGFTLSGEPPSPPLLRIADVTSTSSELSWDIDTSSESAINQYVVECINCQSQLLRYYIPGNRQTYKVSDLVPKTRHEFRVAAYNKHGRSSYSPIIVVVTKDEGSNRWFQEEEMVPFYFRAYFIVPIIAALTVVITSTVVAWACQRRARMLHANAEEQYVQYQHRSSYGRPQVASEARDSASTDAGYDIPWEVLSGKGNLPNDDSYAKLKQDKRLK